MRVTIITGMRVPRRYIDYVKEVNGAYTIAPIRADILVPSFPTFIETSFMAVYSSIPLTIKTLRKQRVSSDFSLRQHQWP